MRIQSNFKEYYDKIQVYTYGKSSIYTRAWCQSLWKEPAQGNYRDSTFYVGFCGKLYCGRRISWYKEDKENLSSFMVNEYFFDIESYKCRKTNGGDFKWQFTREDERKVSISFKVVEDNTLFIANNSPILFSDWAIDICCPLELKGRGRYNDPSFTLGGIGFEKVLGAESAYTELCGYTQGFLASEHKEVPEMSDNIKIASHGFNKSSFRK